MVRGGGAAPSPRGIPGQRFCAHCGGGIEGKYVWFSLDGSEEVPLHLECREAYVHKASPPCDWCGEKMCDGFSRISSDTVLAQVHDSCIADFTKASHSGCAVCKRLVTERTGAVHVLGSDRPVHPGCQDELRLLVSDKCTHCAMPILDSLVQISDPHSYGLAKLHPPCLQAFKQANCPRCGACGETILSSRYSLVRKNPYHDECLIRMQLAGKATAQP